MSDCDTINGLVSSLLHVVCALVTPACASCRIQFGSGSLTSRAPGIIPITRSQMGSSMHMTSTSPILYGVSTWMFATGQWRNVRTINQLAGIDLVSHLPCSHQVFPHSCTRTSWVSQYCHFLWTHNVKKLWTSCVVDKNKVITLWFRSGSRYSPSMRYKT